MPAGAITDVAHWLRRAPQGAVAVCSCLDGQVRKVRLDRVTKRKWVEAAAAIEEIGTVKCEIQDTKGNTIRVTELDVSEEEAAAQIPVAQSADQSTLAHFASLLASAYKDGAKSTQETVRMAFDTMGQLLTLVLKRLDAADARETRMLNQALRQLGRGDGPPEAPEGSLLEQIAGAFLQGKVQAAVVNGAPEPGGADA